MDIALGRKGREELRGLAVGLIKYQEIWDGFLGEVLNSFAGNTSGLPQKGGPRFYVVFWELVSGEKGVVLVGMGGIFRSKGWFFGFKPSFWLLGG